ncbi:MAG: alpha-galactosidase [Clostridia bacterium]|nr:alpha-galactosidase [Clostridia bacterium]
MTKTCDIKVRDGVFHLSGPQMSYIMELRPDQALLHRYWGPGLNGYDGANQPDPAKRAFAAALDPDDPRFSLETASLEFSSPHRGDFREASVALRRVDGHPAGRWHFAGYEIRDGLHKPEGLPHLRETESGARTLAVCFTEETSSAELTLYYSVMDGSDALIRSARITNAGREPIYIERALSALVDKPFEGDELVTFYGSHLKEFQISRRPLGHGVTSIGSRRGASSPQYPPFAALCSPGADEHSGEVRAVQLIYSGNHTVSTERDQYDQVRTLIGISPEDFSWKLEPGESFETPQAVLMFSGAGFNGMSQEFHRLYTDRLFPPQWARKERPVLLNSWEMAYFDVSEEKMLPVIREAADLGFELVVLDDGWFGRRNDSKSSLGDWTVNEEKFPGGLESLLGEASEQGIQFGIWFEPEMISPDSDLMRAHPDWAAAYPGAEPLLSRSQLVLDLTRRDVQDYVQDTLSHFLETYPVSYIKWDMNRHMTDAGSALLAPDQTGEFFHRYMLGLYRILGGLTERFPDVLFESCSSGGGRFDPGMSFYMPQTWCSDNSDGLDRQKIQYGASYTFPPSAVTAHVSAVPNHQTGRNVPFATRAGVAASMNMGYELNILDLPPEDKEQIRRQISAYKNERDLVTGGEFFRLCSPFEGDVCAWMLTDPERRRAVIYAFTPAYDAAQIPVTLKVPYLKEEQLYTDEETGRSFSGRELKKAGFAFRFDRGDYPAKKIVLRTDMSKEAGNDHETV